MAQQRRPRRVILGAVAAWALWLSATARAETIRDDAFRFTFDVPAGFVRQPTPATSLYAFAKFDPADGSLIGIVNVQRMHGTIGRGHTPLPTTGPVSDGRVVTRRWQGYDLDVVEATVTAQGLTLDIRTIQFPIEGEAIEVTAGVVPSHGAEADRLAADVLGGFSGPTNWAHVPAAAGPRDDVLDAGLLITGVLWGLPAGLLLRQWWRRADRAAAGDRVASSARARGRAAIQIGLAVGGAVFLLVIGGFFWALASGRLPVTGMDVGRRSRLTTAGSAQLSGWVVLLTIGVARGAFRIRFGPAETTGDGLAR